MKNMIKYFTAQNLNTYVFPENMGPKITLKQKKSSFKTCEGICSFSE